MLLRDWGVVSNIAASAILIALLSLSRKPLLHPSILPAFFGGITLRCNLHTVHNLRY